MTSLRLKLKTLLPRPLLQKARAAAWSIGDVRHGLRTGEWGLPPAYLPKHDDEPQPDDEQAAKTR